MAPPDPPGSSPPNIDPQDLGELPESPSKQLDLPTSTPIAQFAPGARYTFDLSTNPISSDELAAPFSQPNSASTARLSHTQNGLKRGPSSNDIDNDIDKEYQNHQNHYQYQNQASNEAKLLIRQARDLIVKAIGVTTLHDQQSRLLDLVEIFREYTEFGRIRHTSTLLASQVANLENATKRIEIQSRTQQATQAKLATLATQANTSSGKPTWAKIATQEPPHSQTDKDWTIVSHTKSKNQGGNGTSTLTSSGSARGTNTTSARDTSLYSTRDAKNTALSPSERMIPEVKQSRQLELIKVAVDTSSSSSSS